MIKIIDNITVILWRWTHRIKKTNSIRGHQLTTKIYAPQWWFLWWHYYWYDIGYQAVSPETFKHHLWTRGYFCSTIGEVSEAKIKEYIENQG